MDWQDLLHGLGFHKYAAFHQHIEARWLFPRETFVLDHNRFLTDTLRPAQFQPFEQIPLVDRFDEARPFVGVNLDSGSGDRLRQS